MTLGNGSSEIKLFLAIIEGGTKGAQVWYGSLSGPDLSLVTPQEQLKMLVAGFCGKDPGHFCHPSLHFFLTKCSAEESSVLAGIERQGRVCSWRERSWLHNPSVVKPLASSYWQRCGSCRETSLGFVQDCTVVSRERACPSSPASPFWKRTHCSDSPPAHTKERVLGWPPPRLVLHSVCLVCPHSTCVVLIVGVSL